MLEECAAEGVHVGIWVFDLADCSEDAGDGVEAFSSKIADVVVLNVAVSEALEMHESGISVSQDSMTVSGDDSAFLEGISDILLDDLLAGSLSSVEVLELSEPLEAFLIGQSVQRSSKSVHGSGEGEVGISESRSDEMAGMRRDVSALVVRVDGEISSDAFFHLVLVEAKHVGEVASPIEGVIRSDEVATVVLVPVDSRADVGQLGQKIHGILEVVLPVFGLVGSRLVGLEELAVDLQVKHCHGEHGHGMEVFGEAGDEVQIVLAEVSSVPPFAGQSVELLLSWVPAGGQQEEHGLWEWFNSVGSLLGLFAELRNGVSSEGDSADRVKRRSIIEHNGQSPHSKHCIIDLHLTDNPISMHFSECRKLYNDLSLTFLAGWNHLLLEDVSQAGGSMGEISSDDELHINNYFIF